MYADWERAPNSADYGEIRAARDGGFWDWEGGAAHLRGLGHRIGEIASGIGTMVMHPIDTVDAIRNPVVREKLVPYGSTIDNVIAEIKYKAGSPYGRGEIMGDIVALRAGSVAGRTAGALREGLTGLSRAELAIVAEARGILNSPQMAQLRAAHAAGKSVSVTIGGKVIQYEPGLAASGLAFLGSDAFILGREAFGVAGELEKTLLHELYRLRMTESAMSVSQAAVTAETNAAADFATRAAGAVGGRR
jgi:hypothetical protein